MASAHRRIRYRDLKQPDELLTFFDKVAEFSRENARAIIAGALLLVAILGGVIGFRAYRAHRASAAADSFYQAFEQFDRKNYPEAERGFRELADNAPDLQVGRLARFYLATCYLAQNQLVPARDQLTAYLADRHSRLFGGLALNNLAVVYERLGDVRHAEETYRRAAAKPGPEQQTAQLALAAFLAHHGKRTEAVAEYRRFIAENQYGPERQRALEALVELGAGLSAAATTKPPQPEPARPRVAPAPVAAPAAPASSKH
jgi:predicted negative regulator of RcsB-dependent stress response